MSSLQFPSKIRLERCICKETRRKLRTTLPYIFKTIGGAIGAMGLVKPTSRAPLLHSLFLPGSVFSFLFFPLPFHALMLSLFRIMFCQPLGTVLQFARCTNALLISVLLKCNQNKRFNFSNTFDISWPFKCLDPPAGLVPLRCTWMLLDSQLKETNSTNI